jgi:hypothetical protein
MRIAFILEALNGVEIRALYGLKSSGAVWRSHLANTWITLGFTLSCGPQHMVQGRYKA